MKAIVFERNGGPEVLQYKDIPEPKPGPNEVVIKVKASACNFNDIWARRGLPGMKILLPHISGSDAAGVVVDRGSEVHDVAIGDEVVVHCGIACRHCYYLHARRRVLLPGLQDLGLSDRPARWRARRVLQGPGGQRAAEAART